jgi:hypothetical protein
MSTLTAHELVYRCGILATRAALAALYVEENVTNPAGWLRVMIPRMVSKYPKSSDGSRYISGPYADAVSH